MTSYNIVTTDFPFIEDPSQSKRRPALTITKSIGSYRLVVVAFITTNIDKIEATDILLERGESYFSQTGLNVSSCIQLHKLFTLSLDQFYENIGTLSSAKSKEVQQKLHILFDLS